MITRTHAAATLLSAGLVAGAASLVVAQDAAQPTPTDLYKKGLEQIKAGSLKDAKATLLRVDPLQLSEADRASYVAALKRIEDDAAAPVAKDAGQDAAKDPAKEFLDAGDLQAKLGNNAAAREAYEKGLAVDGGGDAVREKIKARLADLGPGTAVKPPVATDAKESGKSSGFGGLFGGGDAMAEARAREMAAAVAAGDDAMAKQQYASAVRNYAKASELDPQNEMIKAKLASAVSAQSRNADPALRGDLERYEIEHKRVLAEFGSDMEDGRTRLAAHDYVGASRMVSSARARANQGQQWLAANEIERMRNEADALTDSIAASEQQDRLAKLKADTKKGNAATVAVNEKAARVNQLVVTARALQRNGQSAQALAAAEEAKRADPTNMAAAALADILRDEYCLRESDRLLKSESDHKAYLALENREAVIPYTDLITYPTDWPVLSNRRINTVAGAANESDVDRKTRHLLDEKYIENADFSTETLESALGFIQGSTGVNMVVLWGVLDAASIKRDRLIGQKFKHVTAAQLLKNVLDSVSSEQEPDSRLAYAVQGGIVKVATRKELRNDAVQSMYDIRDLLINVENFKDAPSFNLTTALSSSGGGGGGGGGANIFAAEAAPDANADENKTVEELISRIKEHIGTKSEWDEGQSTISAFHSQLMVKTTPENHRALAKLLESFRQTRSVQISVESRFLIVDNNFLEEIGVDLDMTFAGNNGLSPITVQQGHAPTQTSGVGGMAARPSSSMTPANWKAATSGASNPQALTLGASYLNDLQVDLLVSATQARRTGVTLTAPRITFFNGQRAYVLVGRQIAFVSDLTPIANTNAAKATVSTVQSGVVLDVEGTTSADRRYVTLTLRPSLATIKEPIRQIEIRAANTVNNFNGNNNNNNGNNGGGGGNGEGTVLGVIEAPELELTQIRTTVSIPDRGTLMTGGQRLVTETQVEAGVPVLSKIPIIDRLFANTSQVRDERTLLVLIKPTIILQNEEEESRWPGGPQDWGSYEMVSEPVQNR